MSDNIQVRVGTLDDLDQVVRLAQMMHEEIGISSLSVSRILPDIYAALQQDHGIMGLIGEPGEPLQGGILLRIGKLFYTDDDVLEDKGLFIHPEFRAAQGGRAKRLCDFAKTAADAIGLPLLMGVQNDVRTKGKMRLYERMFGDPIGAFFLYTPGQSQENQEAA